MLAFLIATLFSLIAIMICVAAGRDACSHEIFWLCIGGVRRGQQRRKAEFQKTFPLLPDSYLREILYCPVNAENIALEISLE